MRLQELKSIIDKFYELHGNIRVVCRAMEREVYPEIRPYSDDEVCLVLNNPRNEPNESKE